MLLGLDATLTMFLGSSNTTDATNNMEMIELINVIILVTIIHNNITQLRKYSSNKKTIFVATCVYQLK